MSGAPSTTPADATIPIHSHTDGGVAAPCQLIHISRYRQWDTTSVLPQ